MNIRARRRLIAVILCAAAVLTAGKSRADGMWPDLSSPPKAVGGGVKDAAVIVGLERYAVVPGVPGAKQNALDWQSYLTETRGVPPEHVALLLDGDAALEDLRRAAKDAAAQVKPGGTLWFVFIGHGAPAENGKDGLLVGYDAQQKADSIYDRSLPRNELLAILSRGKQAKTVVLLDACFSGKSSSGEELVAGLQPLVAVSAAPIGIDGRTVLMTAARSDQFAGPLPGGSRPAFSYLALGALRGWAANARGQVTASGLVDYVRRMLSFARDRTQTPELSTPQTASVVLGTGHESGPDMAKLQRESASSSGDGFQVTNLPAVPEAQAPQALDASAVGLDFRSVDVDALKEYNSAFELDKSGDASPEDKAASWRQLAQDAPKFAGMAAKRAAQWDAFAAQEKAAQAAKQKRVEARDGDWEKLGQLLALAVVPNSDKSRWSAEFLRAYWKSPGVAPRMAKALAAHVEAGPRRRALLALAKKAPKEEEASVSAPARATVGRAGIQWMRIPGGTFTMGSSDDPDAQPHSVTIKSFYMAKTLVTNKQYKACIVAGACTANADQGSAFDGDDQPVVGVDWNQAKAFSAWVGGRLPSETEWEYAARSGGKDQKYPWGGEVATCNRAVISGCARATMLVCSKPAGNTQQGLCDMVGNAWEWVEDWYHAYDGAPTDGSAWEDTGSYRVYRGGSWRDTFVSDARAAYRFNGDPSLRSNYLSFRPAR